MTTATLVQVQALFNVMRADADKSGYGWAITNDALMKMAQEGANAVMAAYVAPLVPPPEASS
jgi:hypothetical protein